MTHKVLLVGINAKFIHTNLAIRTLRANAGSFASDVELCEYTINHRREAILARLYERNPDVIGFSCYLWNIDYVLSIACDLKKILPDITIVLGGPEVSYHPKEFLETYRFIDRIMLGEGEETFREYLQWLEEDGAEEHLSEIRGLAYRQTRQGSSEIVITGVRDGMEMNKLVFPYSDGELGLEHRILYYESIRGCPFSCSYCLSSIEKSVRIKSVSKTEEELSFFLRNNVPQVKFVDRTFNCNHAYAYEIWRYIGENDNGVTNFHFEIAGDLLREEDFALLASFRPGLVQFEIGVQSTNPDTIRAIRRTMDLQQLRENLVRIRKGRNIHIHLDLIAGLPYEGYDSFCHSFQDVYSMKPDQLQLGFLKLLDGSHMNEVRQEYEMVCSEKAPYEVLSTRWITYSEIRRLKRVEEMIEVYYNTFQFSASVAYLVRFFDNAYHFYDELGQYYEKNGLMEIQHSRRRRYEILWDFGKNQIGQTEEMREELRELLTYDLYRREYDKSPPDFVHLRTGERKKEIYKLLERETAVGGILADRYAGISTKQIFHMVYAGRFTIDMERLIESGRMYKRQPYYLIFDYKKRDPLSHSACIYQISEVDYL